MKQVLSKDEVAKVLADFSAKGKKPTLAVIHAALGHRGSMSTLVRLRTELETEAQPICDSQEGLKLFREVWSLAVEEGRKQQESVSAELRQNLTALAIENERLDGAATAAQDRAVELDRAKSRAEAALFEVRTRLEDQLNRSQAALVQATDQARQTLEKLATQQAAQADEVALLQRNLAEAVRKAHEFELELVRSRTLLEAKNTPAAEAETKPPQSAALNGVQLPAK